MKPCTIQEATHVKLADGSVERIASKWGVDAWHLAAPSQGGFGVVTVASRRVTMYEAHSYFVEEPMSDDVRQFEAQATRVETGPIQFGDDWPGVFIRGDNALAAAHAIEQAIAVLDGRTGPHLLVVAQLEGLMEDLRSCRVGADI